jgi:hypothetical protein
MSPNSFASISESLSDCAASHVSPAAAARTRYPLTVLSPMFADAAISARLRLHSNLEPEDSRTFRIDSRSVIAPVYAMPAATTRADWGPSPPSERPVTSLGMSRHVCRNAP